MSCDATPVTLASARALRRRAAARVGVLGLGVLWLPLLAVITSAPAVPQHVGTGAATRLRGVLPAVGVRGGFQFTVQAWSLGADVRLPLRGRLGLLASGDYFLAEIGSPWQMNLDAVLHVGGTGTGYVGAGVAVAHRAVGVASDEMTAGLNLLVGLEPPRLRARTPLRPFLETRWTVVEGRSPIHLVFGLRAAWRRP